MLLQDTKEHFYHLTHLEQTKLVNISDFLLSYRRK